jgi:membrane protein
MLRDKYGWVLGYLFKWSKQTSMPGFRNVPMYFVFRTFYKDITDTTFTIKASAMAYSFFFSIFPTLIFLFSLLPYVPVNNLTGQIDDMLAEALPYQSYEMLMPIIKNTFQKRGLTVTSIAFLLVLFSASRGVSTMLSAFSKNDLENFRRRNFIQQNLLSIALFFVLVIFLVSAITTLVYVEIFLDRLLNRLGTAPSFEYYLFNVLNWVGHLLLLFGFTAILYAVSPSRHRKWRFFSPGSVTSGVLLFLAELALRWYFVNFANYNKIYGSLTAVMVLMVWFYWISIVILIGFELNASIDTMSGEQIRRIMEADEQKRRRHA